MICNVPGVTMLPAVDLQITLSSAHVFLHALHPAPATVHCCLPQQQSCILMAVLMRGRPSYQQRGGWRCQPQLSQITVLASLTFFCLCWLGWKKEGRVKEQKSKTTQGSMTGTNVGISMHRKWRSLCNYQEKHYKIVYRYSNSVMMWLPSASSKKSR